MKEPSPIDWSTWDAPTKATLLFVIQGGEILLIKKKRGLGAGKINGPGGKIDPGESPRQCALRETEEELGIVADDPVKLGELWFAMSGVPDILCHVYRAASFSGEPVETAEAKPMWCSLDRIPFGRMWSDDIHWFPYLLAGRGFLGRFAFRGEDVAWHELEPDVVWPAGS